MAAKAGTARANDAATNTAVTFFISSLPLVCLSDGSEFWSDRRTRSRSRRRRGSATSSTGTTEDGVEMIETSEPPSVLHPAVLQFPFAQIPHLHQHENHRCHDKNMD